MPKIPSQRNTEILEMHRNGYTYQQIADKYGITRQRAYSVVYNRMMQMKDENFAESVNKVIYPAIRKWMFENRITISGLHRIINPEVISDVDIRKFLTEKNRKISIKTLRKILETTGLTFEEAFPTEADPN